VIEAASPRHPTGGQIEQPPLVRKGPAELAALARAVAEFYADLV
jgi:hypothetical protein